LYNIYQIFTSSKVNQLQTNKNRPADNATTNMLAIMVLTHNFLAFLY